MAPDISKYIPLTMQMWGEMMGNWAICAPNIPTKAKTSRFYLWKVWRSTQAAVGKSSKPIQWCVSGLVLGILDNDPSDYQEPLGAGWHWWWYQQYQAIHESQDFRIAPWDFIKNGMECFFSPMKWAVVSAILIYVVDSTFYSNALKW